MIDRSSSSDLQARVLQVERELATRERWRGPYIIGAVYFPNDLVFSNGLIYLALKQNFNTTPVEGTYWTVFAVARPLVIVPPMVRTTASGTLVGSAAATFLSMTSVSIDTDSMYDSVNARVKAMTAGNYLITCTLRYPGNVGGTIRWSRILISGATYIADQTDSEPPGGFGTNGVYHCVTTLYTLAAGDYAQPVAYQDSGSTLTVPGEICMVRVGA